MNQRDFDPTSLGDQLTGREKPKKATKGTRTGRHDFETVNIDQYSSAVKRSVGKSGSKAGSKSAQKGHGGPHITINNGGHHHPSNDNQTYTPLRHSPVKKSRSGSRAKKGRSSQKNLLDALEYKPPTQIHEQVVASLRREKESLQIAFHSEKNQRKIIEQENDQLRKQLLE